MTAERGTVVVFAPTADGGHARYAWELTRAMAEHPRGYRFELVSTRDLDPAFRTGPHAVQAILPSLRQKSAFRTRLGWALNRATYYPVRERRFLDWLRTRPDVVAVHLQEWKPWLAERLIRRTQALGKRVFYTVHNVLPHRYPPGVPRRLMNHWVRRACLRCDGLFVHSQRLADELAAFLGAGHPPITVVPHGVWTVPDAPAEQPVPERLARRRLLFFGAIRRNKGLHLLLDAAAQLPGYRLTVAGEPLERDYFDNEVMPRVRALRAAGADVELRDGFVPDGAVDALFAGHSAVVLPYTSQFVAQSGVVFLALAYGLPVVASEAGGLKDLLGEYRIGATFDAESPGALAAAVRRLHEQSDPLELDRDIRAARRRFTWQAAAGATIAAYAPLPEPSLEANGCALGTTAAD
jgi:glycosyltransferase involved in cell wall biosynthesis